MNHIILLAKIFIITGVFYLLIQLAHPMSVISGWATALILTIFTLVQLTILGAIQKVFTYLTYLNSLGDSEESDDEKTELNENV